MFRQEDIDRLLEQLNIVDVVGEFVELKKSGANYKGLCPFHADNNPSFQSIHKRIFVNVLYVEPEEIRLAFIPNIKKFPFKIL